MKAGDADLGEESRYPVYKQSQPASQPTLFGCRAGQGVCSSFPRWVLSEAQTIHPIDRSGGGGTLPSSEIKSAALNLDATQQNACVWVVPTTARSC